LGDVFVDRRLADANEFAIADSGEIAASEHFVNEARSIAEEGCDLWHLEQLVGIRFLWLSLSGGRLRLCPARCRGGDQLGHIVGG
jgi:hypothetical protein